MYSHRNGETEPPTEAGRYWCKGSVTFADGKGFSMADAVSVVEWANNTMFTRTPNGDFVFVRGKDMVFPSGEWKCQWWGPVTPPWEQPQPLAVPADVHEAMVLSRETVTQARLALEHVRCDIFLNFPYEWQAERSAPILAALKEFDAYAAWLDAHSAQEGTR